MSRITGEASAAKRRHQAMVCAALGDETRLSLIAALAAGEPRSIAQLTGGARLTPPAIPKHLRGLEHPRTLRSRRTCPATPLGVAPPPLDPAQEKPNRVSEQWDQALSRLKAFVES